MLDSISWVVEVGARPVGRNDRLYLSFLLRILSSLLQSGFSIYSTTLTAAASENSSGSVSSSESGAARLWNALACSAHEALRQVLRWDNGLLVDSRDSLYDCGLLWLTYLCDRRRMAHV